MAADQGNQFAIFAEGQMCISLRVSWRGEMERRVRWKEKKEGSHVRGGVLLSSTKKRQRVNHPRDEIRLLSPLFSFLNQGIISTMHRSNPNKFINEKKTKCLVTSS